MCIMAGAMSVKRELSCTTARVLRLPVVQDRTGLTRDQIAVEEAAGRFPKRISLTARAVGWLESEIGDWIAQRAALRNDSAVSEQLKLQRSPPPARQRMQARLKREHEPETAGGVSAPVLWGTRRASPTAPASNKTKPGNRSHAT
jgi:prophage regulatory protein